MHIYITVAGHNHAKYADEICSLIEEAAKKRGTGIAKRASDYIQDKILEGKAVVALDGDKLAGFCYIESWDEEQYIANSGLIVHPDYRGQGLGKRIKKAIFELSRRKYPDAKIFGITTSLAVMKINSELGYNPVTFSELTQDEKFWQGCQSCPNYDILTRTNKTKCLCTGMMYDPEQEKKRSAETKDKPEGKADRWEKFKRFLRLQQHQIKRKANSIINFKIEWQ